MNDETRDKLLAAHHYCTLAVGTYAKDAADIIRGILDASPEPDRAEPPALPPGWVAVPVELTDEQLAVLLGIVPAMLPGFMIGADYLRQEHAKMLAAAPPCPAVSLPEGWPWNEETRGVLSRILEGSCFWWPEYRSSARALARWLDRLPERGGRSNG